VKTVAVLGSTGSVGTQTLDVLDRLKYSFRVVGLAAGHWTDAFAAQVTAWQPAYAAIAENGSGASSDADTRLLSGASALEQLVEETQPDIVVLGTPGLAGLAACLIALRAGKVAAIANKEPLVAAGELVTRTAREHGGTIVPVDSEHNGVWQCLKGEDTSAVAEIVITSSGGAFRDTPLEDLRGATVEQALNHPTWSMGPKITVDSATLMNKGLEIIEASWLFGVPQSKVSVVLHRQSIVHALVEFADGSIKAQLSVPDMRLPILNALMYPERPCVGLPRLKIQHLGSLTFEPIDEIRYPSIPIARGAAEAGGAYPVVLNAANEVAVERFLDREIGFTDIVPLVAETIALHRDEGAGSIEEILAADVWARKTCRSLRRS
jgi:1-deoxy-D-xylulose-5-phosphate reductoisomerase